MIEKERNIENFKAPVTLYKTFIEQYFSKITGDEYKISELPCYININQTSSDNTEVNSLETDYSLCHAPNTRFFPSPVPKLCSEIPPPEMPIFGTALIVLYELSLTCCLEE